MSDAVEWRDHAREIAQFATRHRGALRTAADHGVTVTFATAVGPDDIGFVWLDVVLEPELLADLASIGARFVATMYAGAERLDPLRDERKDAH